MSDLLPLPSGTEDTANSAGARTALLGGASADEYAALLHEVVDAVADRFRTVTSPSVGPDRQSLRAMVEEVELDTAGIGSRDALREADRLYAGHAVWFHHPAYTAHLNCPVVVPAVAAETMLAAINTSVDTYDQSLVATYMERRLIDWTAQRIGLPGGDGVFTSGGTQSNLQGLFLARERALRGLDGPRRENLPRLRLLAGAAGHFSVARSALLLGLDEDAVVTVADDEDGRLDPAALEQEMARLDAAGDVVMAVSVTAGTTDRGVIDPLGPVARLCAERGVWLHVDAAYGGGLLLSPSRRHLLAGIEHADSVTVDFHKTFFQPVSSSALLVRDGADLAAAAWHADYLNPAAEAGGEEAEPNQVDKSLQTTRRFDALKLWTTLRSLGPDRLGTMVDQVCDLAAEVTTLLECDPDFTVLGRSDLSTVLFRFHPAAIPAARADRLVPLIRRVLFDSGRAMVARTTIDGTPWLKLTLLNPGATLADITAVLDLVRATGRGLLAGVDLAASAPAPATAPEPVATADAAGVQR
ncbi:pyridoxal phosphate-dependent decarboxylase family protein [Brachybacterium sacelli]|uniref:L-2,4-diaminobutyrate decarboxylase n=1 Tax=Brachybacterium sacelli TaxID=173364 RepID=A0ABS4X4J6_9MICO|nr:aspartate aminotransferase family protein [Brachybacterium sacelli]MBP2383390.1 L-2,4-diaminobutyrate decarboxylase [Brachybacterium sacelli]